MFLHYPVSAALVGQRWFSLSLHSLPTPLFTDIQLLKWWCRQFLQTRTGTENFTPQRHSCSNTSAFFFFFLSLGFTFSFSSGGNSLSRILFLCNCPNVKMKWCIICSFLQGWLHFRTNWKTNHRDCDYISTY